MRTRPKGYQPSLGYDWLLPLYDPFLRWFLREDSIKRRLVAKAGSAKQIGYDWLESIPNVGPAIAAKLRILGFESPSDLAGQDPYAMFRNLCELTGKRHDPCLLDVFISAVSFANGEAARPWWKFTTQRKAVLGQNRREERE